MGSVLLNVFLAFVSHRGGAFPRGVSVSMERTRMGAKRAFTSEVTNRASQCHIKDSSLGMWSRRPQSPLKTKHTTVINLDYPQELDGKALLLKMPFISDAGSRENNSLWIQIIRKIKLELTWKLLSGCIALIALEGATPCTQEEKLIVYPWVVNPACYIQT